MQSRNAIGNLKNRYLAVLKKCNLMNVFGSLAVASALVIGSAGLANANLQPTLEQAGTKEYLKTLTYDHDNDPDTPNMYVYLPEEIDAINSAYIVEEKKDGKSYLTTFTRFQNEIEKTYGILLKSRYYDGSAEVETFANITDFVLDAVTSQKPDPFVTDPNLQYDSLKVTEVTPTDPTDKSQYSFSITNKDSSGAETTTYYTLQVMKGNSELTETVGVRRDTSSRVPVESDIVSNFINHSVNTLGGAIYNEDNSINTITGDFINNSTTSWGGAIYNSNASIINTIAGDFIDNNSGTLGGAIYNGNASIIKSITGDFINNSAYVNSLVASGGAISNVGSIGTINGNFINNSSDNGGAIANGSFRVNASIGTITGSFINNRVDQFGGAIDSTDSTINSITADFINNKARDGGAISLRGTNGNYMLVNSIVGDFINNSAQDSFGGGAIYINGANSGTSSIGAISGSFLGNSAISDYANGGAIYTDSSLTFKADKAHHTISGNYTQKSSKKDYNAIYFNQDNLELNFDLANGATYTLNDNVKTNGTDTYTVNITADESGGFILNNVLNNASAVNVTGANLQIGKIVHDGTTYSGSIGNANLTLNNASVNIGVDFSSAGTISIGDSGDSASTSGIIFSGNTTIANGGILNINNGKVAIDPVGAILITESGSSINIAENGALDFADDSLGGINAEGGIIDASSATLKGDITNNGTVTVYKTDLATTISQSIYENALSSVKNYMTGDGTIDFHEVTVDRLYSLDTIPDTSGTNLTVMAGTLVSPKDVSISHLIKNTETDSADSTIESGASLTITGANSDILSEGNITNSGTLILGEGTIQGIIINNVGGEVTNNGALSLDGIQNSGTYNAYNTLNLQGYEGYGVLNVGDATSKATINLDEGGYLGILSGGTLNLNNANINMTEKSRVRVEGDANIISESTFESGGLVIQKNGSLYINSVLDVSDALLTVDANAMTFEISESGKLIVSANNYGKISEDGTFDDSEGMISKMLDNDGSLILENVGFEKMEYSAYNTFLTNFAPFVEGNGVFELAGVSINTENTALGEIQDGTSLSENVVKGGTFTGGSATLGGIDGDVINKGELTLTGKGDAGGVLVQGDAVNDIGMLTLENGSIEGSLDNKSGAVIITGNVHTHGETNNKRDSKDENFFQVRNNSVYTTPTFTNTGFILVGEDDEGIGGAGGQLIVTDTMNSSDGSIIGAQNKWQSKNIEEASTAIFNSLGENGINGIYLLAQNSYSVLGDDNSDWALKSFAGSGLTWGGGENEISAALFLNKPQTLSSNGLLIVDGSYNTADEELPTDTNKAIFAANSLLTVNASNMTDNVAALSGASGSSLTVDDTAKLVISGGSNGQEVTIVDGFTWTVTGKDEGWKGTNLIADSSLMKIENAEVDRVNNTFTVTLKQVLSDNPYLSDNLNTLFNELQTKYPSATDHSNSGVAYLSRLLGISYLGDAGEEVQAKELESSFQIGALGANAGTGFAVAGISSDTISSHNSLNFAGYDNKNSTSMVADNGQVGLNSGSGMMNGVGVWFMPMYKWSNVSGVDTGSFEAGYSSGLAGAVLGMDYTMQEQYRFGLAVNVGSGHVDSSGDLNKTENDFDFWGVSLYAAYQQDNLGLSFDVGYTGVNGDIKQDTNTLMAWGQNTADVSTDVWTVGLNAEYKFNTSVVDITPHVGVRYLGVTTDSYDVKGNGGVVSSVAKDTQNIVQIPVGVTFSKEIVTDNNWSITPKVDLGFVANTGDTEATSKTSVAGLDTATEFTMQNVDNFAFSGGIGVSIAKENLQFGLDYKLQASGREDSHAISATFRYEF